MAKPTPSDRAGWRNRDEVAATRDRTLFGTAMKRSPSQAVGASYGLRSVDDAVCAEAVIFWPPPLHFGKQGIVERQRSVTKHTEAHKGLWDSLRRVVQQFRAAA